MKNLKPPLRPIVYAIVFYLILSMLFSCTSQKSIIGCDGIPRYSLEQPTDSLGV